MLLCAFYVVHVMLTMQADYFSKLLDIFQRLPRYADLADANCPNPFNTLPNQSGVEASSDALDLYEEVSRMTSLYILNNY